MKSIERQLESQIEHKEKQGQEIHYHFLFSPHATAEDFKKLEKAFKRADIYFAELSWKEENKKDYEDLSQGRITPEKLSEKYNKYKETAWFKEWDIIYNSKKPILFADVSEEFDNKLQKCLLPLSRAFGLFTTGAFKKSLDECRSFLDGYAKTQSERQKIIKENLDREMEKFQKANPDYT